MKKLYAKFLCSLLLYVPSFYAAGSAPGDQGQSAAPKVRFLENRGQMTDQAGNLVPSVLFKASVPGLDLYVTTRGLTYVFSRYEDELEEMGEAQDTPGSFKTHKVSWSTVDLQLQGATINTSNLIREEGDTTLYNYFLPNCADGLYGVREFGRLTFKNIYPGIDWVLYNAGRTGFKYDFVVRPEADLLKLKLAYKSLEAAGLVQGRIEIKTSFGKLIESAPVAYFQESGLELPSAFRLISTSNENGVHTSTFGFKLENGNANETVVIDPLLNWSTFYGGNTHEGTKTIEIDKNGNVFSAGYTSSWNLPLLSSSAYYQGTMNALGLQFITKFSPGGALLWATYYGGSGSTVFNDAVSLAIDTAGNVFLGGTSTASNFPTQTNSTYFQSTPGGAGDATIIKFSNQGTRLWATYFGGNSVDNALSICVDVAGNVFMVGNTQSTNLPLQNAGGYFQSSSVYTTPGFFAKFNNGGALLWSTYFDGYGPMAASVDPSGNLVTTGAGFATALVLQNPGGGAYFQNTATGAEAALVKFSNTGNLLWSTYLGGSGIDQGRTITSDIFGNVFVGGITTSTNFPLQGGGGYQQTTIGSTGITIGDAYICKFSPTGAMLWSTYYGGNDNESFFSYDNLCTDSCGNVYFSFDTKSSNMSTLKPCEGGFIDSVYDFVNNASIDIFLVRFDNGGKREWATYIGGSGGDFRSAVDLDASGKLFMTGEWVIGYNLTENYPIVSAGTGGYLDSTSNGGDDVFFMRFDPVAVMPGFSYGGGGSFCLNSATVGIAPQVLQAGGTFSAAPGLSLNAGTGVVTPSASLPGSYTVTYAFTFTNCLCGASPPTTNTSATTTIVIVPVPTIAVTGAYSVCLGSATTLTATGASSYTWNTGFQSPTISLSPQVATAYTVTGSQGGCAGKSAITVSVLPLPVVVVAGNNSVCLGEGITLTASGATSYTWNTGAQTSTIFAAPPTNSVFVVTGTDLAGCISPGVSASVNVIPLPTLVVSGNTSVCPGSAITQTVSGAVSYTWSTGAQTNTAQLSPSQTTVYTITGANAQGCMTSIGTTVTVKDPPTLTISPDRTVCLGKPTSLSVAGAATYTWSTGATIPTINVSPSTSTVITVSGINSQGCSASAQVSITVKDCTGVEEIMQGTGIRVYPNPNNGEFTIEGNAEEELVLVNAAGQLIKKINLTKETSFKIGLTGLAEGVYFLKPASAKGFAGYRIVVQGR